jgi:hypothetical protein
MIILKSFNSAHEAIHWLSVNPIEGASIETTPVLKSIGSRESKLSNGNYHVVIKSEPTGGPQTSLVDIPSSVNPEKLQYNVVGAPIFRNATRTTIAEQGVRGPQTDTVVEAEAKKDGHTPVQGKAALPVDQSKNVVARTVIAPDGRRVSAVYGKDLTRRDERAEDYIRLKEAQQRQPTGLLARMRNLFRSASDEEIIKAVVENVVKSILNK